MRFNSGFKGLILPSRPGHGHPEPSFPSRLPNKILYAQVFSRETYNALEAAITKCINLPNLKDKKVKDMEKTSTDVLDTSDRLAKWVSADTIRYYHVQNTAIRTFNGLLCLLNEHIGHYHKAQWYGAISNFTTFVTPVFRGEDVLDRPARNAECGRWKWKWCQMYE